MSLKMFLITWKVKSTYVNLSEYGDIWDIVIYGADGEVNMTVNEIQFKINGIELTHMKRVR